MVFMVMAWWSSQIMNTHHSTFVGFAVCAIWGQRDWNGEDHHHAVGRGVSASLLDLGHRATKCKYRMLRGAGQHPSYWSSNGQGQCYSGEHQWLEIKGPFSRRSSTQDIGHRPDTVKSSHKAVISLLHADGRQLRPQSLVLSRLYSLLLNI
jgi:hypothetical protein